MTATATPRRPGAPHRATVTTSTGPTHHQTPQVDTDHRHPSGTGQPEINERAPVTATTNHTAPRGAGEDPKKVYEQTVGLGFSGCAHCYMTGLRGRNG